MSITGAFFFSEMAPKKNYTKDQLNAALDAIARGMPVATAAKTYSVPRVTLLYKSTGKLPVECRMGPSTILTSYEETLLEQWILSLAQIHHPVNKDQLLDSVQLIVQTNKRANPFTNSRPGRKWYEAFLRRHPNISERVAQNLTAAREKVSEQQIRQWFQEIEVYLRSKNLFDITNDPKRVYNCDESAFFLQPKGNRVLAKKGDKSIYHAGTNDEKENLTVLVTANAAGKLAPPMVIFKYERIPSHIALSINKRWGIGRSESGWMCGPTFYEYITNVFVPWLNENKIKRPILMFIDGHVSHLTLNLSQFCSENGIELFALFPNSTHLIQPLDVAVFKPLKVFWRKSVRDWQIENYGQKMRKENFGEILERALSKISNETMQNGFRVSGLSPFNVENVTFSKISNRQFANNTAQVANVKEGLAVLEKFIPRNKLQTFKTNFDIDWNGNIEDTALFNVWKEMKENVVDNVEPEVNVEKPEKAIKEQVEKNTDNVGNLEHSVKEKIVENKKEIDMYSDPEPGCSGINLGKADLENEVTPKKILVHSIYSFPPATSSLELNKTPNNAFSYTTSNILSLKDQVPTPFKKALFWPEETKSEKKRKKEKIPSTITAKAWQEYHLKKEENKKKKIEEKQKKAEVRKQKKDMKAMELQNKIKRKRKVSESESSSDDNDEWIESGDSMDDIEDDVKIDVEKEQDEDDLPLSSLLHSSLKYDDVQVGDFILANFLGGKRQTFFYRYICIVQKIYSQNDIEVVSLKSINEKSSFKLVENDISTIKFKDILEKLPQPKLHNVGDRIKYDFSKDIDIFEA